MIRYRTALVALLLSLPAVSSWGAGAGLLAGTLPRLATPEQFNEQEVREYTAGVLRSIARDQRYPLQALQNAWEGTARVNMTIGADGTVKSAKLVKSSGHTVLDLEAVNKVVTLSMLPKPPSMLRGREFHLAVPVRFRLE